MHGKRAAVQQNTRYVSKYRPLGTTTVSAWIMLNTFNGQHSVKTENRDFFLSLSCVAGVDFVL